MKTILDIPPIGEAQNWGGVMLLLLMGSRYSKSAAKEAIKIRGLEGADGFYILQAMAAQTAAPFLDRVPRATHRSVRRLSVIALALALLVAIAGTAGAANLADFGGHCDGGTNGGTDLAPWPGATDNTPALNAFIAGLLTDITDSTLVLPGGICVFKTQPNRIDIAARIVGQYKTRTHVLKMFPGGFMFLFTGAHGDGGALERMAIINGKGMAPGYAIILQGDATHQPDEMLLSELLVTGESPWFLDLLVYGNARTAPQGIREVRVQHSDFFAATAAQIWLSNVVGFEMAGGGVFPAGGTACEVAITGVNAPLLMSTEVSFTDVKNNCPYTITNTLSMTITGGFPGGGINADSVSHYRVEAFAVSAEQ